MSNRQRGRKKGPFKWAIGKILEEDASLIIPVSEP